MAMLGIFQSEIVEAEFLLHRLELFRCRVVERHPDETIRVRNVGMNLAHRYVG